MVAVAPAQAARKEGLKERLISSGRPVTSRAHDQMLPGSREASAATDAAGITAKEDATGREVPTAGKGLNCEVVRQSVLRIAGRTASR